MTVATDAVTVAASIHRLAVLLQAGLAPTRAWQHLIAAEEGASDAGGERGAGRPREVVDVGAELSRRGGAWSQVAVVWHVASTVGAPLADSLRGIADALRDAEQTRDDIAVALAEPATTARLIAWLPLLGVFLVVAFGFDLTTAVTHPLGVACLVGGAALMFAARRWTAALVRRAQPDPGVPGWECEVVAVALSGGVSIDRALAVCDDAGCPGVRAQTMGILQLSQRSGAPAVELLRAEAADRRRAARTDGRLRVARLAGRLLIPLGVCTLPAFLLLGVAPMLLSVLSAAPLVF